MPSPHFKHSKSWRDSDSREYKSKRIKRSSSSSYSRPRSAFKMPVSIRGLISFLAPYLFIAAALGLFFMITLFAWYSRNLPHPDKIIDRSVAQSTKIYDRTGERLLFEVHGLERRTIIPLDQIPDYVKWGTILVEDKKFYEHGGFDIKGIIRAVGKDILTLSKKEGASTLTQQLVKNALLSNEKAWSRKIKELVLSYQIERKFSKDQILQLYFNEIPYGSNAYGIESASQLYFNKSAKDLTIAEGAALAALPRATTFYSPFGSNVDRLLARKDFIIGMLKDGGYITPEQGEAAANEELVFSEKGNLLNSAPHFVIMVREQMAEKYGEREVEQGGLKIITTLDWDMQKAAEDAVASYAEQNKENFDATNAALVAIDPKNGHILAMVGSRDYFSEDIQGNFNVAAQGKRQPGSSFKPFVYAVGFEKGYTDKTTLWDVDTEFGKKSDGKEYEPHNYDLKERGPISIRTALQGSINIPAVKMLYLAGAGNVIERAKEFGYTTLKDPDVYGLSLVLGGAEVTLLEHTSAYAAFAAKGTHYEPVSVVSVEDSTGKMLQEWKESDAKGKEVMDKDIVLRLTDVLSDNSARAPFFGEANYLTLGGRPVAAKTGTTNDYRDAWTMGYTPQLAAGVWVGNNDFSAMRRGAGGSAAAAPIWNKFMKIALENYPVEQFEKADFEYPDKPILRGDLAEGTPIKIDKASGKLATEFTPETYIEEKIFRTGHNILYYINPEDPLGPAPSEENRDPIYPKWEKGVQAWMEKNDWKADEGELPTEYDDLHVPEDKPSISITEPADGQTLSGEIIFFKVEAAAKRGISRVEFFVDDKFAAVGQSYPYTGRYIPDPTVANGFHTLKAVAYDDIDNNQTVSVDFNLFLEKTNLAVEWNEPKANAIFNENDFPIRVRFSVPNSNITKAELFAEPKGGDGEYRLIQTINSPAGETGAFWSNKPDTKGKYEIYAVLWDDNNSPHRVPGITVELDLPDKKPIAQ